MATPQEQARQFLDSLPEFEGTLDEALASAEQQAKEAMHMTETPPEDLQAMIQQQIAQQLGALQAPTQTFEQVLAGIDPRDSDAALAMYEWLHKNGRLYVIGTLQGAGYLETYQEPKGATKAGYAPGSTTGGRMVDAAVEKAQASGAVPVKKGLCPHCYSAVKVQPDGVIMLDADDAVTKGDGDVCQNSPDGKHGLA